MTEQSVINFFMCDFICRNKISLSDVSATLAVSCITRDNIWCINLAHGWNLPIHWKPVFRVKGVCVFGCFTSLFIILLFGSSVKRQEMPFAVWLANAFAPPFPKKTDSERALVVGSFWSASYSNLVCFVPFFATNDRVSNRLLALADLLNHLLNCLANGVLLSSLLKPKLQCSTLLTSSFS